MKQEREPIFLASDDAKTISLFRKVFTNNLYSFSNIVYNNGKNIHDEYERNEEQANIFVIDTIVDMLLLAMADKYIYKQRFGF